MTANSITNAGQFPKRMFCRHMRSGIAGYENENILVDDETIKRMCASFEGMPVYVQHQEVDLGKLQEAADGYIVKSFYNEKDGWFWAEFIAVSDKAHTAISQNWAVSNAYVPTESGEAGQHLGVDYHRKILNGYFTHMAIVPNPRYEDAVIMTPEQFRSYQEKKEIELEELRNSKSTTGVNIMTLFGKIFKKERVEVTNSIPEDADLSVYEIEVDGVSKPLSEIINAVKKNEDEKEKKDDEEKLNDDTEVSVGDKKMSMKELMNKYNAIPKKNADDDKDDVKNEADDEEEKKKEKQNADELRNAHKNVSAEPKQVIETQALRLARGKELYSIN